MTAGLICRVCDAETDAYLCRPCCDEITRAIGDMQSLLHELSVTATKQARVYRASRTTAHVADEWVDEQRRIPSFLRSPHPVSAMPATPMPFDWNASDALWAAGNTLSTWTRHLIEQRNVPESQQPTAKTMIVWLTEHAESFRFDEAGAQAHDELTGLHRDCERAVDRSPSRIYAGPCHAPLSNGQKCQRDIYARPGAPEIVCDGFAAEDAMDVGCQHVHTAESRQQWLLDELEDALLPLEILRRALPSLFRNLTMPAPSTWRSWQARGRLMARGLDLHGQELFRGGDVLELVQRDAMQRPKLSDRSGTLAG